MSLRHRRPSGLAATKARALKVTREMALVGPFIKWADEPKIEATAVTTIAEYKPVSRVDPGDQRVGHRLGHGNRRDGQAGDQVPSGVTPGVAAGRRAWLCCA